MNKLASLLFTALLACTAHTALAVDTSTSTDAPDLSAVRARIDAGDFKHAIGDLKAMVASGVQHADVYNLLGYSLRKSGDAQSALTWYRKALDFDPNHKGALEYLGELYVEVGDLVHARANLAKLAALCPQGCEEREDLEQAIARATPPAADRSAAAF